MKYWQNEGKHSEFFEKIWGKYVPTHGESENPIGEVVRCFGRINYEMGNNGCCNMFEEELVDGWNIWDCEGDDEREREYVMTEFYTELFETLKGWVDGSLVESLKEECEKLRISGNFKNVKVIDQVGDALGDKILKVFDANKILELDEKTT
jgi:hypothetical protein